jgi:hypothetical protein
MSSYLITVVTTTTKILTMQNNNVRQEAQAQAEKAYDLFILWSKRTVYAIIATLLLLASCDFGADTETGSQYNGAVYAPRNMGD